MARSVHGHCSFSRIMCCRVMVMGPLVFFWVCHCRHSKHWRIGAFTGTAGSCDALALGWPQLFDRPDRRAESAVYAETNRRRPPLPKGLFVPDAFTNPAHFRFALKVTLASMICYFFIRRSIGLEFIPLLSPAFSSRSKALARLFARVFFAPSAASLADCRALYYHFPHPAHGVTRFTCYFGRVRFGDRRMGLYWHRTDRLRGFADGFCFFLQPFSGFKASPRTPTSPTFAIVSLAFFSGWRL